VQLDRHVAVEVGEDAVENVDDAGCHGQDDETNH
jgi:hypothetical protein